METELGFGQTEGMLFSAYKCLCIYEHIKYLNTCSKENIVGKNHVTTVVVVYQAICHVQIQKTLGIWRFMALGSPQNVDTLKPQLPIYLVHLSPHQEWASNRFKSDISRWVGRNGNSNGNKGPLRAHLGRGEGRGGPKGWLENVCYIYITRQSMYYWIH